MGMLAQRMGEGSRGGGAGPRRRRNPRKGERSGGPYTFLVSRSESMRSEGSLRTAPAPVSSHHLAMSRGMQLEAAVDNMSLWYFEDNNDDAAENERWLTGSSSNANSYSHRQKVYYPEYDSLRSVSEAAAVEDTSSPRLDIPQWRDAPFSGSSVRANTDIDSDRAVAGTVISDDLESIQTATTAATEGQDKRDSMPKRYNSSSRRSTGSSSATCTDLVVSGYTLRGSEKKVMYHIDVVGHESQLQTYTIRRSYSDFKSLHNALSEVLEARRDYYRSRAPPPLRQASRPDKPYSDTAALNNSIAASTRRSTHEVDPYFSSPEYAMEVAIMSFNLPHMPHAGFLSFWKRHDRAHLQSRCEAFQEMLRAVLKLSILRESFALQKFLSIAPCALRERGSSYVSLCEYSVPHLDRDEEFRERKRRARESRRNSSANSTVLLEY